MKQLELIYESPEDAIRDVAQVLGGVKLISQQLWLPSMTAQAAHSRFLDCLNTDRPHKFSPSEIEALGRIGRESDYHAIANYYCEKWGYEKPVPLKNGAQINQINERIAQGLEYVKANMEALKRLGGND